MSREERDMSLHCSSVASLKGIESTSCQWSEERAQRETKGSDMDGLESSPSLSRFSGFESFHLTFPLLTNDYNFRNLVSWLVLPFGANGWYLGSCMLPSHPRSWRSLGWVTQGMIESLTATALFSSYISSSYCGLGAVTVRNEERKDDVTAPIPQRRNNNNMIRLEIETDNPFQLYKWFPPIK